MNLNVLKALSGAVIGFISVSLVFSIPSVRPMAQASSGTTIFVDLSDRTAYLFQGEAVIATYPVAVGRPGWETPIGQFEVTDMRVNPTWLNPRTGAIIPPNPNSPIGDRWIEFASKGEFKIGFHGTNQPNSVGLAASDGCLRMKRHDLHDLYASVYIGASVIVRR